MWTGGPPKVPQPGMGLRFLALDRRAARALAEWVDERTPLWRPDMESLR